MAYNEAGASWYVAREGLLHRCCTKQLLPTSLPFRARITPSKSFKKFQKFQMKKPKLSQLQINFLILLPSCFVLCLLMCFLFRSDFSSGLIIRILIGNIVGAIIGHLLIVNLINKKE